MNRDIVQGNWKRIKGQAQARWGLLVGDYLRVIAGRREQFNGVRQRAFGTLRAQSLKLCNAIAPDKTKLDK